ncbi:MAG: FliH/SctL family protein [Myxococcales bacterium]
MSPQPEPRRPRFLGPEKPQPRPKVPGFLAPSLQPQPEPAQPSKPEVSSPQEPAPAPRADPPVRDPAPKQALPEEPPRPHDGAPELAEALRSLRLLSARLAEEARGDALEVAFQVARRILEAEVGTSAQPLFAVVRAAVARAGESRRLTLRVSPADAPTLAAVQDEKMGLSLLNASVVEDPTLAPGECIVESDLGRVEGHLTARREAEHSSASETRAVRAA